MSTRTITSPGVELRESDLSLIAPQNVGTNVFVTGFSQQGPIDEVLKITSSQELDQIYGTPTNSAERYFYYSIQELLNSPANIYTTRLPYGLSAGDGFGSKYSALVYPAETIVGSISAAQTVANDLTEDGISAYVLGAPTHMELTQEEYQSIINGTGFDWSSTTSTTFTGVSSLSGAGAIVLNKAQTTINDAFEGYYIGLSDNTGVNPATDFDNILGIKTVNDSNDYTTDYIDVPAGTLQFHLSAEAIYGPNNSISEIMENLTDYSISGREEDDTLSIGVFKLRKSIFATEAFKLDFVLEDAIVGSTNSYRTQTNPYGGPVLPYFIEARDTKSRNVEVIVNKYISNSDAGTNNLDTEGNPIKKTRVYTSQLSANDATVTGIHDDTYSDINVDYADNLYGLGAYSNSSVTTKEIGEIPIKLHRALEGVKNDEIYDIDVVAEAGLGTVFASVKSLSSTSYDEFTNMEDVVDGFRTSNELTDPKALEYRSYYSTIFDLFEQFCSPPHVGGGRGDCIFIADPSRHFFVQGRDAKVLADKANNFQQDIYWPVRHQFSLQNTSYAATYGQWEQVYDAFTGRLVWVPFSGFGAAVMARSDAAAYPWSAPAGFTRGLITNATDMAVNPNQKQRDEFYKNNVNPVAFFPSNGQVVFGQKTLSRKPSAFDRINVRRLFLALERPTKKAAKYFVFEPNTEFTRTRLINTLTPIFENAKNNEGLYDYIIVCDERNNTPEVIDANELVVDIYLKPVRTAEFIRINFFATRTDASFEELINQ